MKLVLLLLLATVEAFASGGAFISSGGGGGFPTLLNKQIVYGLGTTTPGQSTNFQFDYNANVLNLTADLSIASTNSLTTQNVNADPSTNTVNVGNDANANLVQLGGGANVSEIDIGPNTLGATITIGGDPTASVIIVGSLTYNNGPIEDAFVGLTSRGQTTGLNVLAVGTQIITGGTSSTLGGSTGILLFNPSGSAISAYTLTFPATVTLVNGQKVSFSAGTFGVTTLTLSGNSGQTVVGAQTSITSTTPFSMCYFTSTTTWYRCQ